MLLFSVSFLAGISQILWLPKLEFWWLIVSIFFALGISAFLTLQWRNNKLDQLFQNTQQSFQNTQQSFPRKWESISFIILFGFILGFAFGTSYSFYTKKHQLKYIPDDTITVTAQITGLPKIKSGKATFFIEIKNVDKSLPVKKLLVSWYDEFPQLKAGQLWQFELKLKPNHSYQNPASFDYAKWLFRHKIDAIATVKNAQYIVSVNQTTL